MKVRKWMLVALFSIVASVYSMPSQALMGFPQGMNAAEAGEFNLSLNISSSKGPVSNTEVIVDITVTDSAGGLVFSGSERVTTNGDGLAYLLGVEGNQGNTVSVVVTVPGEGTFGEGSDTIKDFSAEIG